MADVIKKATNKFTKGLIMDFSPENTQNEILTHALNATLLTFNGNELSLQNDMGNARVETAFLPEGYIPVGTCEYGGIIYIVSYNPLEDKSQIGCFPSPERNVSREELGISGSAFIDNTDFQKIVKENFTGDLSNTTKYVILRNDSLNPGDKFLISSNDSIYQEHLENLQVTKDGTTSLVEHPIIAINVVSIEDSGKIVYLNSDLRQYSKKIGEDTYTYHVLGEKQPNTTKVDIDSYRNVLSSGYNVFRSKTSGKLAILAELITIDSYSVTHSIQPRKDDRGEIIDGYFDVIIHTEVTPEVTPANYLTVPKLKYYYLDKSQGYIQTGNGKIPLFTIPEGSSEYSVNDKFISSNLTTMYVPTVEGSIDFNVALGDVGEFNFPKPETYHGHVSVISLGDFETSSGYTKFEENKLHRVHSSQVKDYMSYYGNTLNAKFYVYQKSNDEYKEYKENVINEAYTYYVQVTSYKYEDAKRDEVKYKNTGRILYKLSIEPEVAGDEQKQDTTIEKFQNREVVTYIEATDEDYQTNKPLWEKDGETYSEVLTKPDDFYSTSGKYFTKESKTALVSVGFDVSILTGTMYYYPDKQVYVEATSSDLEDYWNFNKYPLTSNPPYGCPIVLYASNPYIEYRRATQDEIYNRSELGIKLYYKAEYVNISSEEVKNSDGIVFISIPMDVYVPKSTFTPSLEYNYILGESTPDDEIPAGDPLALYDVADFIPNEEENYAYNDLKLGNVKIPNVVSVNGLDLPFKYDYTIVPCMNYGKLPHLAVSNTVDFSKLHAFNQSNFNIWKYRIDGNQLRLTFGTEVFDTYENDKVDAVILEFYDLWGFAGSLEITNKKSYTGTFTKILDLNSLNSLSTKKISGGGYTYNYARNINIQEAVPGNPNGGFKFGGKEIQFIGHDSGWRYADGSELGDNNDCGALYSNIVYGVKTYFRRTIKGEHEFTRKGDLFMFTLPIYNDYYYTVDNYNTLENPQLEMFLTYKIVDDGTKVPLNYGEIIGGYCPTDKNNVSKYISGSYDISKSTSLNLIKYYKFKGTSNVNLEVGLKKEYSDFNLGYDPIINSYFTCTLKLISDDSEDRLYTVKIQDDYASDYSKVLNYANVDSVDLPLNDINHIGFSYTYDSYKDILQDFNHLNFLYENGVSTIPINYEFVVGYKINITDIRATQVPATTVCALFHQKDGEYNYKDFGIRKVENDDGSDSYLSDVVFYNEGDSKIEKFGLASQISTSINEPMARLFSITDPYESQVVPTTTSGKLNTQHLKYVTPKIGKLAFCTPHAHAITDMYNAYLGYGLGKYIIGVWPHNGFEVVKRVNMVASTESMFLQGGEFISAISGLRYAAPIFGVDVPIGLYDFSSVDVKQLSIFNKKLLKTMSSVYAYNPDYDSLDVFAGDVKVENNNIQFISNLISTNANFNFPEKTTLNNYIFMGPMCFNNFIDYLSEYSGYGLDSITTKNSNKNPLPQLGFIPNYTFCGKKEEPYLISSITYNIPVVDDIVSDLNYTSSNSIIVKHSDSSQESDLVVGTLNKKSLYGFSHEYGKLIELDVSNYTIDSEGELSVITKVKAGMQTQYVQILSDYLNGTRVPKTYATFSGLGGSSEVDITVHYGVPQGERLASGSASDGFPSVFVAIRSQGNGRTPIIIHLEPVISENDDFSYEFTQKRAKIGARVTCLDPKKIDITNSVDNIAPLTKLSYANLKNLMEGSYANLPNASNTGMAFSPKYLSDFWHEDFTGNSNLLTIGSIYQGGDMGGTFEKPIQYNLGNTEFVVNVTDNSVGTKDVILLYEIKIPQVDFVIQRYKDMGTLSEEIIPVTTPTTTYTINSDDYCVDSRFDDARLRGTSITLNDLLYKPSDDHRLYMKRSLYTPANCSIGYRSEADKEIVQNQANEMRPFRGPSFLYKDKVAVELI